MMGSFLKNWSKNFIVFTLPLCVDTKFSAWQDSNLRQLASKARTLPDWATCSYLVAELGFEPRTEAYETSEIPFLYSVRYLSGRNSYKMNEFCSSKKSKHFWITQKHGISVPFSQHQNSLRLHGSVNKHPSNGVDWQNLVQKLSKIIQMLYLFIQIFVRIKNKIYRFISIFTK